MYLWMRSLIAVYLEMSWLIAGLGIEIKMNITINFSINVIHVLNIDINFNIIEIHVLNIGINFDISKFRFWISILISILPKFMFWMSILISIYRNSCFEYRYSEIQIFNNIINNLKSTSKTHLLTIKINRNNLLALEYHFKLNLLTIIF